MNQLASTIDFQEYEEDLSFSVDGRLLSELGEKLVTKNYLALSELIKNGYDADSSLVEISLHNVRQINKSSKIIIRDEGEGMSWEELKNNWMRISTSNKERFPISDKYGRKKTGSKGIGRFACQKLADAIHLETVKEIDDGLFEVTEITVRWDDFRKGVDLVNIDFSAKHRKVNRHDLSSGTTITLFDLKEKWTQISYNGLLKELASLSMSSPCRREGFEEDPGFNLSVRAEEFEFGDKVDLSLNEKILDSSWGRLKAKIAADGEIEFILEAKLLGKREYKLKDKFPMLSGISFDLSYFPDMTAYLRNPEIVPLKVIRPIRAAHAGVKVYSEGFRVYPYGQDGDDWLNLDKDVGRRKAKIDNHELSVIAESYGLDPKRAMLNLFSNKMLIGSVMMEGNTSEFFQTKLNREGFVENDAFKELYQALRTAVEWMTIQYSSFKYLYADEEAERVREEFDKVLSNSDENVQSDSEYFESFRPNREKRVSEAFKIIQKALSNEIESHDSDVSDKEDIAKKATELLSTEFNTSEKEVSLLRSIASTGPLFFVFAHEFRGLISNLDTDAGSIEQWVANVDEHSLDFQWLLDIATSLRQTRNHFMSLEKLIGIFSSTHKIENKKIRVQDAVNSVVDGFAFITKAYNIVIKIDIDNKFLRTTPMPEASFYSILVNLLSNSIKAVLAVKNCQKREILISASRGEKLVLDISDNGIGLDQSLWEDVFKPLITDPTGEIYQRLEQTSDLDDLAVLGKGTGLGLNIVRGMVAQSKGQVKFIEPHTSWSTTVQVQLP